MTTNNQAQDDVIEQLAAIEHERWADWQKYVHSKCLPSADDGIWNIGECFIQGWNRQINTPYSELTEQEKESDREQVRRYFPIIESLITAARQEGKMDVLGVLQKISNSENTKLDDDCWIALESTLQTPEWQLLQAKGGK